MIHARAVVGARARLVVFPELSLTGYELDAALVEPGDAALDPIVAACAATGSTALVGAPVPGPGGRAYIAMLEVSPAGVAVLYRKQWIGGDEAVRFSPGDEPTVFEVDGWRLGVGICRDTGIGEHVERMAELDIDAYVAGLVHRSDERAEQQRDEDRGLHQRHRDLDEPLPGAGAVDLGGFQQFVGHQRKAGE